MKWPLLLVLVILVSVAGAEVAISETLRIEAETMTASYNISGLDIAVRGCSAASGGQAVDGLDIEGEWIQIPLELTEGMCFTDSLRSAGDVGSIRSFAIHIEANSSVWAADTVTTIPGSGIT